MVPPINPPTKPYTHPWVGKSSQISGGIGVYAHGHAKHDIHEGGHLQFLYIYRMCVCMWKIMIGHLGHFLLDLFGQIWTEGTLRHMLDPILVFF